MYVRLATIFDGKQLPGNPSNCFQKKLTYTSVQRELVCKGRSLILTGRHWNVITKKYAKLYSVRPPITTQITIISDAESQPRIVVCSSEIVGPYAIF